tara:strand:- start:6 stop:473 length:468 start_codon:yes stop_codon:yes gene_type:complete
MAFNLINLFISVAMGIWKFSFLGSNHAQFSLFAILVFVLAETIVMYFFIATGKSIKEILSNQNTSAAVELWEEIKYIKKLIFPQIMLTISLIGGLYIFYFGYIISNTPITSNLSYSWILIPLLVISIIQHLWSLKIKNESFILQIEIVRKISTNN